MADSISRLKPPFWFTQLRVFRGTHHVLKIENIPVCWKCLLIIILC